MKYGEVLGRAFKALGSGSLWAFGFTAFLAVAAPFVAVWGLLAVAGVPALVERNLPIGSNEAQFVGGLVVFYATLLLGGLLSVLPLLAARGGLIHAADAALSGRTQTVGQCWGFGFRNLGRTFAIEFVVGFLYMLAILVAEIPFILVVTLGAATGGQDNSAAMIGSICCGYLLLFAAIMVIAVVYVGVESLAIRYGLIGGRTFGDAISAGWKAFRVSWKRVVVYGLIMLALAYGWQTITSLLVFPLVFMVVPFGELTKATPDPAALARLTGAMVWIYGALLVLYAPFTVFNVVSWTAFFRRLTGLDAPVPASEQPVAPATTATDFPATPPMPPSVPPAPPEAQAPVEMPDEAPSEQTPDA